MKCLAAVQLAGSSIHCSRDVLELIDFKFCYNKDGTKQINEQTDDVLSHSLSSPSFRE